MRRLLIAGCGYVGSATADLFQAAGWEVEGWTGSAVSAAKVVASPYPVIPVDITSRQAVNARPENFDVVIHCASTRGGNAAQYRALYVEGVRNLFDRFIGATLLFTSSTSVYAQHDGEWVDEQSGAEPDHETGQILREAEQFVLSRGGTVARLAGVHGPGRSAILKKFLRGEAVIDKHNDRFANHIHRDDIASALVRLIELQPAPGEIYNVADDVPILRTKCYQWLANKLNRPVAVTGLPHARSKRGVSHKRVRNLKLRGTGWMPRYRSFPDAMEHSILPSFGL